MTIFAIVMILVVGIVTFFHLLQGFFSATISAIMALIAAVLALSYHETIAQKYLAGNFPDMAYTFVLLGMFAIIYLVGRTIFDKAVPGNLRLPPAADKIGGAVMGIIAGVFTAGIIAIAAQEMPFRGSIWGYARLSVDDQQVNVPTNRRAVERNMYDSMNDNTMDEAKRSGTQSMLVPVDEILIGETKKLSEGGPLSGATQLSAVHPDWLTELFGQRMGIEPGAKRTAINDDKLKQVKVDGVYALKTGPNGVPQDARGRDLRALDSEFTAFRSKKLSLPKDPTKDPSNRFFVLRVTFDSKAADRTGLIRLSPATIRLVTKTTPPGATEPQWTDHFPIGTLDLTGAPTGQKGALDGIPTIFLNKADDFIFVNERSDKLNGQPPAVDFVYFIDANGFVDGGKKSLDSGKAKIADGSFLEVKRMAMVDLSGMEVQKDIKPTSQTAVLRKEMAIEDQIPKPKSTSPEVDPIEQRAAASRAEVEAARKPSAGALSPTAQKLVGRWTSVKGNNTITLEFDNQNLKLNRAGVQHDEIEGPWKEVSAAGDNITIHANFPRKPQDMVFKFETNDSLQMQDGTEWVRFDRK